MPLNIWMRRNEHTLHPATSDDQQKLSDLPEGEMIEFTWKKPRSADHHRFFFAAIAEAYANWPEKNSFRPKDAEHLRAWLLCKARYCKVTTHELGDAETAEALAQIVDHSLSQCEGFGFAVYKENKVYVLHPNSISWGKLKEDEFVKISSKVSDILKAEMDMSLDDFKKEAGKAA